MRCVLIDERSTIQHVVFMDHPIRTQLDLARSEVARLDEQLAALQRQREVAIARVEAFSFALETVEAESPKGKSSPPRQRVRLPTSEWIEIFKQIASVSPHGFDYDDIMRAATSLNVDVKRPSLRTKMMTYANDGLVQRVENGKFRFTPKGYSAFEIMAPSQIGSRNENEPQTLIASSGSDADEAPTSSERS